METQCVDEQVCVGGKRQIVKEEAQGVLTEEQVPEIKEEKTNFRDYWATPYGRLLQNPELFVNSPSMAKTFKRRFIMGFVPFLEHFIPDVKRVNLFAGESNSGIPVEIKCMIAMRILGRGFSTDDIEEMSGIAESTCNRIFFDFLEGMYKHFVYVANPPTDESLKAVVGKFARRGTLTAPLLEVTNLLKRYLRKHYK